MVSEPGKRNSGQVLGFKLCIIIIDLAINAASPLLYPFNTIQLVLYVVQDTMIMMSIIIMFLSFFATYIFQAGLISVLIVKFRLTIGICFVYLFMSILYHVWSLRQQWSRPFEYIWSPGLVFVYVLQRTTYKKEVLSFGDAKITYSLEPTIPSNFGGNKRKNQFIIIFVTCTPRETDKRKAARDTWANPMQQNLDDIGVVFIVGKAQNTEEQIAIEKESQTYSDILQVNVEEHYKNLTWKTYFMFWWFLRNAKTLEFAWLMKTDIDTVVFSRGLNRLRKYYGFKTQSIFGFTIGGGNAVPIRNPNSKWYVSLEEFSKEKYPIFTSGTGYLMTGDVPKVLVSEALTYQRYFFLEDVLFTGILAEKAGIDRIFDSGFLGVMDLGLPKQPCAFANRVTWHTNGKGADFIRDFWLSYKDESCNINDEPQNNP